MDEQIFELVPFQLDFFGGRKVLCLCSLRHLIQHFAQRKSADHDRNELDPVQKLNLAKRKTLRADDWVNPDHRNCNPEQTGNQRFCHVFRTDGGNDRYA